MMGKTREEVRKEKTFNLKRKTILDYNWTPVHKAPALIEAFSFWTPVH